LQKEKTRVYILARELNIDSKDLLNLCKQAGLDVKNQLSSLEPEQRVVLEDLIKKGTKSAQAPSKPSTPASLPDVNRAVPTLPGRPRPVAPRPVEPVPAPAPAVPDIVSTEPAAPPPAPAVEPAAAAVQTPVEPKRPVLPTLREKVPTLTSASPPRPVAPAAPPATVSPAAPVSPAAQAKPPEQPAAAKAPEVKPALPPKPGTPPGPPGRLPGALPPVPRTPHLGGSRARIPGRRPGDIHPGLATPRPATPPPLRPLKPPVKPEEKVAKPIARPSIEQLKQDRPLRPEDILKPQQQPAYFTEVEDEDDDRKGDKDKDKNKKVKAVPGRDSRQRARNERAEKRKTTRAEEVKIVGGRILDDDEARPRKTLVHIKKRLKGTMPRKGRVELVPPITVRALSEALGIRSVELLFNLQKHGAPKNITINSVVEPDMAELLAVEHGAEIDIRRPPSAEELLLASFDKPDTPEDLRPRAPIVTVMGHVDHGKTSLLDKIRESNIASTEAGGITQVIRAWRVEHGGRPITFLDTPGHEAFTKMRARGAQVTDVAVIVVAADDGVMPQTEEAISHARAAGVSLVIAINKVDLPSANVNRTRQQLYGLNVLPDNMGGDTPFVETSAATGKGIDELLDQLSVVAELKELKANPSKLAKGSCLEASLSEGEGVRATLLVREGTLRRGDVVVCGHAYGRVRQMYNDMGKPIEEAGPSVPVRITGLDEVPNADDPYQALPDLSVARQIAEGRKAKLQEASLIRRAPLTLERLTEAKVAELKVILKADFRGSIEAIKKELEKLDHDEVKVKLLHSAVGGITESDVDLALTSPEDTLILGFNVVPDDRAMEAAEEKGVEIRQYDIIYKLTSEIKQALEGKLKPREEVVHLGRAVVRDLFKISRVGTIAGCSVTQGTIRRNAKVRIIRDGAVIYPPVDRSAGLDSLKRFKEDVAEVREGFECGIKVAGYDDIKVGDIIEAFRVEQVQRTLEMAGAGAKG
jgi:translation initiation factor IF-2